MARALYSRAGILVLDDIFSAVDANVGRHILEHALSGPLGQHRTRILATHHMDLCISAARYHVKLGRGIVKQAVEITASPLTGRVGMGSQPNYLGKITPEVTSLTFCQGRTRMKNVNLTWTLNPNPEPLSKKK